MNIPDEQINTLIQLCLPLNGVILMVGTGTLTADALREAKSSMVEISKLLRSIPPFSCIDFLEDAYDIGLIFSDRCIENALSYIEATQTVGAATAFDPQFKNGVGLLKLIQTMAQLVKRMHYMSYVGLFRSDLFEGLCVGHAPRKCPICRKWFLTTNARQTKYCGGLAPDDKHGRTCRQIGNLKGREQRELADDHPIKAIYTRRMNTITQCLRRGKLDEQTSASMKRLAKNRMERAISDHTYAKTDYINAAYSFSNTVSA